MPSFRSYVGDRNDPAFHWDDIPDGVFRVGNLPRRIVPADPLEQLGLSGLWALQRIQAGDPLWRQIDWAGWGAAMTGKEIVAFWDALKPQEAWLIPQWEVLRAKLIDLDPARRYVLVVAEQP